jgi:NAD-dependent deacetylase
MKTMAEIEEAIQLIRSSRRIVAFSGAGISTEAGIPDFRGPGGMWEDPELLSQMSASGFKSNPEGFYKGSRILFSAISRAEPTLAHQLLVRLEQLGKMEAVITQNIDGLHHRAGSTKVYELHGTLRTGHCTQCRTEYEMQHFYQDIESARRSIPLCDGCRAPIKPDIVLFEDILPAEAWDGSVEAAEKCDLMLVLGSSLVVYPAAELPMIALSSGAKLAIVNLEATSYDRVAAVTVQSKLGEFARSALAAFMDF